MKLVIQLAMFPVLGILTVTGCSDLSDLGNPYQHGDDYEPGDGYSAAGPEFPTEVGTEIRLFFNRTYQPFVVNPDPACGGLTQFETQVAGHICLEITGITNNWANNGETEVNGLVKITNSVGTGAVDMAKLVGDCADPTATIDPIPVTEIDNEMQNLWHTALFPFGVDHTYFDAEQAVTFGTRGPLNPPDHDFAHLLFFDPRISEDELWNGWATPSEVGGAVNFVGKMITYFYDRFGSPDFFDNTRFDSDFKATVPASCVGHIDQPTCDAAYGCAWNAATTVCDRANLDMQFVWRETLTVGPAELVGDVIHSLSIYYTPDGVLKSYDEYIVNDGPSAPTELSSINGCPAWSGACAQSHVTFNSTGFAGAPCTF